MPARLEDIKWNLKPGGITYLTRDQWNLVMEEAMARFPTDGSLRCAECAVLMGDPHLPECVMGRIPVRDPLLVEREKTHGSFETTASIAQELKGIFRRHGVAKGMQHPFSVQVEALDMIATKLARILSGNPHEKDHWLDLAGYAKLGAEACDER